MAAPKQTWFIKNWWKALLLMAAIGLTVYFLLRYRNKRQAENRTLAGAGTTLPDAENKSTQSTDSDGSGGTGGSKYLRERVKKWPVKYVPGKPIPIGLEIAWMQDWMDAKKPGLSLDGQWGPQTQMAWEDITGFPEMTEEDYLNIKQKNKHLFEAYETKTYPR